MQVVRTFSARDGDGNEYKIQVLQGFHHVGDMNHPHGVSPDALQELRTEDGRFVNHVEPGVYDIIDGMAVIRITSDDPNAP